MTNLKSARAIWFKGGLFVAVGIIASLLLVLQLSDIRYAVLLPIAIWAFCRAYYFAFYVIEKYVDSRFRFAGLLDFMRYALLGKTPDRSDED